MYRRLVSVRTRLSKSRIKKNIPGHIKMFDTFKVFFMSLFTCTVGHKETWIFSNFAFNFFGELLIQIFNLIKPPVCIIEHRILKH